MRKFLLVAAAALTIAATGVLATSRAEAIPLVPPAGPPNLVDQVALCFYFDGWNGPGMYECGYRHRRGYGWHGEREERRRDFDRRDRGWRDDGARRRPQKCPPHYTVQDGVCKPYTGR